MREEIFELIQCPSCCSDLNLSVDEGNESFVKKGYMVCSQCMKEYQIEDDIIYFSRVPEHRGSQYQKNTYSFWWNESHKKVLYDEEKNREIFEQTIKIGKEELEGSIVLDAGSGDGRFAGIVAQCQPKLLVLCDISDGIRQAYQSSREHTENVVAVQADISNSPFKEGRFDNVYSWGVLHHTPNTLRSFNHVSTLVRNGGKFGVYVYENHPLYRYDNTYIRLASIIREILVINPLRIVSQFIPARLMKPFFLPIYLLERTFNVGVIGCHRNNGNRFEWDHYFRVVIDRFKTRYATEHSIEEIVRWFIKQGFNNIEVGDGVKVCVTGQRDDEREKRISVIVNV